MTKQQALMVSKIKSRLACVARHARELTDLLDVAGELGTVHEMRLAAKLQDMDANLVELTLTKAACPLVGR